MPSLTSIPAIASAVRTRLNEDDLESIRSLVALKPDETFPIRCSDVVAKIQRLATDMGFGSLEMHTAISAAEAVLAVVV